MSARSTCGRKVVPSASFVPLLLGDSELPRRGESTAARSEAAAELSAALEECAGDAAVSDPFVEAYVHANARNPDAHPTHSA